MKKNIFAIVLLALVSCNPVGEDLAETAVSPDGITSIKGLDLKKGEEIVFWSKVQTGQDPNSLNYNIKYSIALNNKIVSFDSTSVMEGNHTINSKVERDKKFLSGLFSDEASSSSYEFEIENKSFVVPENGKYDFDFKFYYTGEDFFRDNISIVIKGKK